MVELLTEHKNLQSETFEAFVLIKMNLQTRRFLHMGERVINTYCNSNALK